jgi:lantibiotic modifying enzyme
VRDVRRKRGPGVWRPILTGEIAKRARQAVEGIAAAIRKQAPRRSDGPRGARKKPLQDASLAGGTAALAVFYAYLSRAVTGKDHRKTALRYLQEAGDAVESVVMDPSLYGGFSGVAWATAHLQRRLFEPAEEISTEAIDEALRNHVNRTRWRGDYDLVGGLVGFGVYALERLPSPTAVVCLEGIVDRLEETSRRRAGGITWHTSPNLLPKHQRKECPRGYYNLGLAHGVPGVIALLGAASAAGVRRRKARRLLDGAVAWLLRQKLTDNSGARFPAWIAPGLKRAGSRSAWCYGDPGVAAALLCAARCVGEPAWEREALEIARAAANRPSDQAGVVDAGLCHGATGLGHLFNRMYQETGDATLARAARFWFDRTLAMRQPGRGVGGFSALAAKEDGTRYWEDDSGILTGAAGIGLALLAATTSIEPAWDRMLLVSTPGFK